jgi:NAD+-dependent farnesol dehydrogenase
MRVLLTGATGYVGSRVAARLAAAGHAVLALVRSGGESRVPAGCRAVTGDILDAGALKRALGGCDALVHMAALVRTWVRDSREFDRVNIEGVASALRCAEECGTGRIVYTSTIVALGPTDGEIRDEAIDRSDFRFHTDYERSKWVADRLVRERAASGSPVTTLYPGVVYGAGASTQGNLLRATLESYLKGRLRVRLGRGDLRICYAFIDDVAEGHLLALEKGAPGRGYILGGENATQDRLFSILHELTGLRGPHRSMPYLAAEIAGRALRAASWLTGIPPAFTDGVVSTFRHEWAYSSDRACREIGYRITPLHEGLRRTLAGMGHAAPGPAGASPGAERGGS